MLPFVKVSRSILFVVFLWFIMAIINMPDKVLGKSALFDTNAQIVVVHMKKIIVFGKI
jgi:hypothetical protein